MQEPLIFTNNGQRLFGTLHIPDGAKGRGFPAIVMLHGFTGQRIETHRLFVKAARRFAADGILVLRFDFRGCGESDGNFEDLSIDGQLGDAMAAIELVRRRQDVCVERVALLGFSLGGAIAATVAGQDGTSISCLVLWAAVADLKRAFYRMAPEDLLSNFGKRDVHDYFGNALSQRFIDELLDFRPTERVCSYRAPVLIMHGSMDEELGPNAHEIYRDALGDSEDVETHIIDGADHTFSGLSWQKELIDKTSAFLKRHLLDKGRFKNDKTRPFDC